MTSGRASAVRMNHRCIASKMPARRSWGSNRSIAGSPGSMDRRDRTNPSAGRRSSARSSSACSIFSTMTLLGVGLVDPGRRAARGRSPDETPIIRPNEVAWPSSHVASPASWRRNSRRSRDFPIPGSPTIGHDLPAARRGLAETLIEQPELRLTPDERRGGPALEVDGTRGAGKSAPPPATRAV